MFRGGRHSARNAPVNNQRGGQPLPRHPYQYTRLRHLQHYPGPSTDNLLFGSNEDPLVRVTLVD